MLARYRGQTATVADSPHIIAWLAANNGIARREDAHAAGHSEYAIKRAVASGRVRRIRGHWIAIPDAALDLVRAATVPGRLTCVTGAARHGLWTPASTLGHIAVDRGASRFDDARLKVHWARGPMATSKSALVDPIENVLFHVARCQPEANALAVWESAVRTGGLSLDYLRGIRWASTAATKILDQVSELSDSGLESHVVHPLLRLGLPVRQQVEIDEHDVDVLIGDLLVVQIDGFAFHSDAAQRRRDIRDDARLVLRGYTVLRFDFAQVMSDWPYVEATILGAVAQGLHRARPGRRVERR
jgi:very-short-patch-repair endonuclease